MKAYKLIWCLLVSCLVACGSQSVYPENPELLTPEPTLSSQIVELEWVYPWTEIPFKSTYEPGEYFAYALDITNHLPTTIELSYTRCQHILAFDEPLLLHLIAPDGTDLLAPYQRQVPAQQMGECTSEIQIAPNQSWREIIDFSRWLHLRQIGTYQLWAEYEASPDERYTSNILTFEIQSVPTTVSPQSVDLHLEFEHSAYRLDDFRRVRAYPTVTFNNQTNRTLTFLKPLEGSYSGSINPIYQFTAWNQTGRSLGTLLPDGNSAFPPTNYDEDTMITLMPGEAYTLPVRLMYFPEMFEQPGEYQIQLTYIVRTHITKMGIVFEDEPMNWDDDVFTGVLESNVVTLTVTTEEEYLVNPKY